MYTDSAATSTAGAYASVEVLKLYDMKLLDPRLDVAIKFHTHTHTHTHQHKHIPLPPCTCSLHMHMQPAHMHQA